MKDPTVNDEQSKAFAAQIARLVEDTSAKMDDPDRFERNYVLEDLLERLGELAESYDPAMDLTTGKTAAYDIGDADAPADVDEEENYPAAVGRVAMPDGRWHS